MLPDRILTVLFFSCFFFLGASKATEEAQAHSEHSLGVKAAVAQKHAFQEYHGEARTGTWEADTIESAWKTTEILNPDQRSALDVGLQTINDFEQDVRNAPYEKQVIKGGSASNTKADNSLLYIFINTLMMALASGIGAVPFYFVKTLSKQLVGVANAIACGVMLACSFDLIHEGEPHGPFLVVLGVGLGMLFVCATQKYLAQYEDVKFENLKGAGARKILLVVGIMAAHAIGEGSGVGVAYSGNKGWSQGVLVTLAIGLHNIPEGLAVATVMVSRGVSVKQATLWAILTALPQTVVALPSYLFVEAFSASLPIALGFAAGSMVWVVFAELMPDALEALDNGSVATAATLSAGWLEALRMILSKLETSDGLIELPIKATFGSILPLAMAAVPTLIATSSMCFIIKTNMAPRPGVLGAFVGIQISLAASSVLWEVFEGGGVVSSLLWAFFGFIVASAISILFLDAGGANKNEETRNASQFRLQAFSSAEDPWGIPTQVLSRQTSPKIYSNSGAVTLALLSTCVLFAFSEGVTTARATINHLENFKWLLVPSVITGALFGVMSGLGILLFPMRKNVTLTASIVLGSFSTLTSIICLLPYPLDPTSNIAEDFDKFNHTGKLSSFVGGILLGVNFSFVWPLFVALGEKRVRNGLLCGLAFGLTVKSVLGGLCFGTPYCLI